MGHTSYIAPTHDGSKCAGLLEERCNFCRLRQLVIGIRNAVPDSFVSSTSPATFESKIKTVALFTNYGLIVKDAYDVAAFKKRSKTGQKKFFILASLYLGLSRRTIVPFRQNNSL
jgi:hypothetical protein